jgi:hypothetical protein
MDDTNQSSENCVYHSHVFICLKLHRVLFSYGISDSHGCIKAEATVSRRRGEIDSGSNVLVVIRVDFLSEG